MAVTAVLFIHGFPFDHAMWRHQVSALSRWRCIAPDLRGAGSSPGPDAVSEYSMAAYAADVIALLDRLKLQDVVVCGLSMGGYIAFELLRSHPARVRAAILCNTKSAGDTPEAKRDRDAMAKLAQESGSGAIAEKLISKVLSPGSLTKRSVVVEEARAMMTRQPVHGIVGALRALRDRPDSTPLLGEIRVPVLVVAGSDDQITPADGMRALADAVRGAELVVIPEAGHVSPLEQPLAVSAAISKFLAKLG